MGSKGSFVRRPACARRPESALGTCRFSITASPFAFHGMLPHQCILEGGAARETPATTQVWDERHALVFNARKISRCQEMTNWPEYNNLRRPPRLDNRALKALY